MRFDSFDGLSRVDPTQRVLLLSYCLRPSASCPGKFSKKGLICPDDCQEDCSVGRLQRLALNLGYKGVCVASGGSMALRYVQEYRPRGIVAVACEKELEQGVEGVGGLMALGRKPEIVIIPLTATGCVDTSVDEEQVREALVAGCYPNSLADIAHSA
ncbi:MAG: DUF116 domain-containing protein [Chloroflexota bacterium]